MLSRLLESGVFLAPCLGNTVPLTQTNIMILRFNDLHSYLKLKQGVQLLRSGPGNRANHGFETIVTDPW